MDISFSFDPPSSQQLWTPPWQEHAACIYLQREHAIEEALANADFSVDFPVAVGSTPLPPTPAESHSPSESKIPPASQVEVSTKLPKEIAGPVPSFSPAHSELPSEFDVSPPFNAQPPPPVVLKAHQRANLENRFHARVDSPTPSEDTYQRLLNGYSFSTSTPKTTVQSYSVDPASLVRPDAPEPASFNYHDDQQAEIDRLKTERAGLKKQLKAYKDMTDSLIEQTVERSFSDRDERRLNRRLERLQRRLDDDDGVITQQKIQISLIEDERDSIQVSLQKALDLLKDMSVDMNHQADRIEDLEGDLHEAHQEIYSLTQRH